MMSFLIFFFWKGVILNNTITYGALKLVRTHSRAEQPFGTSSLGVDSPFFSTIVIFLKTGSVLPGFPEVF